MPSVTLTDFQYSTDLRGWMGLYIFHPDGYHPGAIWFKDETEDSGACTSRDRAHRLTLEAMDRGAEVRITNGGDMLVFHSRDGAVLYMAECATLDEFWQRAGA